MDKERLRQSFSRSSKCYDQYADVQLEMMCQLLTQITELKGRVLDVGCGTGLMARLIVEKFPDLEVVAADFAPGMIETAKKNRSHSQIEYQVADGEFLPFADNEFDCVISNAAYQWMDPKKAFVQAARVLRPEGQFYFTTFGPDTLKELKTINWPINDFYSSQELERFLQQHFKGVEVKSQLMSENYKDFYELLSVLKAIGSRGQKANQSKGLLKKETLNQFIGDGKNGLSITYEAIFGRGTA